MNEDTGGRWDGERGREKVRSNLAGLPKEAERERAGHGLQQDQVKISIVIALLPSPTYSLSLFRPLCSSDECGGDVREISRGVRE